MRRDPVTVGWPGPLWAEILQVCRAERHRSRADRDLHGQVEVAEYHVANSQSYLEKGTHRRELAEAITTSRSAAERTVQFEEGEVVRLG